MAIGTAAGLLRSPDDKPQSFFKHSIIEQYFLPFVTMVGSKSPGRKVVVLDGYAGRGRYDNEQPGSAEILLMGAERASSDVHAFLVEKNRKDSAALSLVAAEYTARHVSAFVHQGPVEKFLPGVIAAAAGVPLFLFLDPCGAVLPFNQLSSVLSGPRAGQWPQTEVLLNFSANFTRRAAGALLKGHEDNEGVLKLDETCGGQWWRATATKAYRESGSRDFAPAAEAVAIEYGERLAMLAGSGTQSIIVPVRARLHHQPLYHLVFLTRSNYGVWVFGAAIGKARQQWMRMLGPLDEDDSDPGTLFSVGDVLSEVIASEEERSFGKVRQNVLAIVGQSGKTSKLVQHASQVFAGCYGTVTEPTIRRAVRELQQEGRLNVERPTPRHLRDWVLTSP